jgi:ATP-dependent Clp protease ATP-binding subunit ClpX
MVKVNTQNILFICGGAFEGIDKVIGRRVQTSTIGFKNSDSSELKDSELIQHVNAQDLRTFGLIPELLGRLPVVTHLMPLDKSALKRILTEPKNALVKQYQKLMEYENAIIEFTDDGIDYIVQKAIDFKLGGRGLRSICEVIMTDAMFDIPSRKGKKKITIDEKYAREHIEKSKLSYLKVA